MAKSGQQGLIVKQVALVVAILAVIAFICWFNFRKPASKQQPRTRVARRASKADPAQPTPTVVPGALGARNPFGQMHSDARTRPEATSKSKKDTTKSASEKHKATATIRYLGLVAGRNGKVAAILIGEKHLYAGIGEKTREDWIVKQANNRQLVLAKGKLTFTYGMAKEYAWPPGSVR